MDNAATTLPGMPALPVDRAVAPPLLRDSDLTTALGSLASALSEELAAVKVRSDAEHGWAVGRGLEDLVDLVGRLSDKVDSIYEVLDSVGLTEDPGCCHADGCVDWP